MKTSNHEFEEKIIELIEDNKNATKNELRMISKSNSASLLESINKLESRCSAYENQIEDLRKENQRLQSKVNQCQSEIKNLKSTVRSLSDNTVCAHKEKVEEDTVSKETPHPSQQSAPEVQDKHLSTLQPSPVNQNCMTDQQLKAGQSMDGDQVRLANPSPDISKGPHADRWETAKSKQKKHLYQTPVKTPSVDQHQLDHRNQHSTSEKKPIANDQSLDEKMDSQNRRMPSMKKSPSEMLNQQVINHTTSYLLIGDSVIRGIDQRRMAPHSDFVQKICIPGATTLDIQRWLSSQSTAPNIKIILMHIGVNDCPAGPVSAEDWRELITLCDKVFPNAAVTFSSLIPAKGRNNLNNAILPTNRNLQKACDMMGVSFIDNTYDFIAPSGAPKLAMYHDLTHPSSKGTARLAANMKGFFYKWNETYMKASRSQSRDMSTYFVPHLGNSTSRTVSQRNQPRFLDKPSPQFDPSRNRIPPNYRDSLYPHGSNQDYYNSENQQLYHNVYDPRMIFDYNHGRRDKLESQLHYRYSDVARQDPHDNDSKQTARYYRNAKQSFFDYRANNGSARTSLNPTWSTMMDQVPVNFHPSVPPPQASLQHYPMLAPHIKNQQRLESNHIHW